MADVASLAVAEPAAALRQRCPDAKAAPAAPPAQLKESETTENMQPKNKMGKLQGFAGTVDGSFFKQPPWVDTSMPPGMTSQAPQINGKKVLRNYLNLNFLVYSPNLVWLSVALFDYFVFPYDLEAAKTWASNWIAFRFFANFLIVFGYFGFWHVTLYFLEWGKRPFNPNRAYKISKVVHNMFYTFLGVLQWTLWEAVFMHCLATGRMPYVTDAESFGTSWGLFRFVLTCGLVAIWRDMHFYFAHRFIHIKFLYKYVHSLHHRNTDVEPFSGLCMHPIEHLLYFACCGPALYVYASPFCFMWFGVHLLISPAASHSGYEDNFQSDQFHYLHHRFFECNYGTGGIPYDKWFGTFRDSLDVNTKVYKGAHVASADNKMDSKSAAAADTKATLKGSLKLDQVMYNALCYMLFPVMVAGASLKLHGLDSISIPGYVSNAQIMAFMMSAGPLLVGITLLGMTSRRPFANPRLTFLYPFHKEKLLGAFGFNASISFLVTAVPVYHLSHMLLSEPGEAVYFSLYGGR